MKIKSEHFEFIKNEIQKVIDTAGKDELITIYESGKFFNSHKVKDLQTRFNFDLLYAAGLNNFVCDELYSYMNDDHINTALNRICPKVVRNY